jgi:hypothetical protein
MCVFFGIPWVLECTMGRPKLMKIFISLIPHNLLMQIESPNNMLHISIMSLNSLLNLGV